MLMAPTRDLACNPGMCPDSESTGNPLVRRLVLNPLSHTSQGSIVSFPLCFCLPFEFVGLIFFHFVFYFKFYLFIYFSREEEGKERRRETSVCGCLLHSPCWGNLACNPGMCHRLGSNQQPFCSQAGTQSTEAYQPGPFPLFL